MLIPNLSKQKTNSSSLSSIAHHQTISMNSSIKGRPQGFFHIQPLNFQNEISKQNSPSIPIQIQIKSLPCIRPVSMSCSTNLEPTRLSMTSAISTFPVERIAKEKPIFRATSNRFSVTNGMMCWCSFMCEKYGRIPHKKNRWFLGEFKKNTSFNNFSCILKDSFYKKPWFLGEKITDHLPKAQLGLPDWGVRTSTSWWTPVN